MFDVHILAKSNNSEVSAIISHLSGY